MQLPHCAVMSSMTNILLVCTANICRSPMAQMVATHLADKAGVTRQVRFDSAGTQASRLSEPADPRTKNTLAKSDYPVNKTRSRRITIEDFARFDLILAMDQSNLDDLRATCPAKHMHKLHLFLEFAPNLGVQEIPDPYYGGPQGFDRVLELCEAATNGLLDQIRCGTVLPHQTL